MQRVIEFAETQISIIPQRLKLTTVHGYRIPNTLCNLSSGIRAPKFKEIVMEEWKDDEIEDYYKQQIQKLEAENKYVSAWMDKCHELEQINEVLREQNLAMNKREVELEEENTKLKEGYEVIMLLRLDREPMSNEVLRNYITSLSRDIKALKGE